MLLVTCPFGCMPYVNKNNADVAQALMNKYIRNPPCHYDCRPTPDPVCNQNQNKCVAPTQKGGYKSDMVRYLRYVFSLIIYIYICTVIFIDMPMNGIWRLPGNWNKDSTITYGIVASLVVSMYALYKYQLPIEVSIVGFVIIYMRMQLHPKFNTP